ncbi:MAG: hypothetical protein O3A87_05665 [Verrucomicrobia bacterium]|nr:hypothetical protein [Verrucomicrobiota bacterium]MDA1005955.1 hypothetical protein [Verrucomicrobiota bacterium]
MIQAPRTACLLLAALLLVPVLGFTPAMALEVLPLTEEQRKEYDLDPAFFTKGTLVEGILIATSDKVTDFTHLEAAYLFGKIMGSIKPEVAERIRAAKVLCVLVAHNEVTSDVPQFKSDKTGEELNFYNWRQRGFLTKVKGRSTVLFAEEDVLEYEGGMQLESILIHEFGHVIQRPGFDEDLEKRLKETYEAAMNAGLWKDGLAAQRFKRVEDKEPVGLHAALVQWFPHESPELLKKCLAAGDILVNGEPAGAAVKVTGEDKVLIVFGGEKSCYATTNRAEYWAEGVQCWYDTNRTMDHDHNHIHTRAQLKEYDPGLAKLCAEVLGEAEWRFVSPRERAGKDHLKGYDPAQGPVVVDSEPIKKAGLDYYDTYWHDFWQRLYDKHGIQRPEAGKAE